MGTASTCRRTSSSRATWSSSTGSGTWASTSAAASSSTLRTRATWSRSRASPTPGTRRRTSAPSASSRLRVRRVQLLDLGGEVLLAHPPLELQGRRDLAVLGREVAVDDGEPLDLLEARVAAVDLLDDALDEHSDVAVAQAPFRDLLLVERDQRGDVGTAVADDERLRDEPGRLQLVLEVLRRDVLAARGDDDVLLAVGHPKESVVVELADVAAVEPPVAGQDRSRRLLVLQVAREDRVGADQNLAVLRDLQLATGQRRPHGAEPEAVGPVDRRRRGDFGEAVPLEYEDV